MEKSEQLGKRIRVERIIHDEKVYHGAKPKRVRFDEKNLEELTGNREKRPKIISVKPFPPPNYDSEIFLPDIDQEYSTYSSAVDPFVLHKKLVKLEVLQKKQKDYLRYNLNPKGVIKTSFINSGYCTPIEYGIEENIYESNAQDADLPFMVVKRKKKSCNSKLNMKKESNNNPKPCWKY